MESDIESVKSTVILSIHIYFQPPKTLKNSSRGHDFLEEAGLIYF